jgi:hypothetical protein
MLNYGFPIIVREEPFGFQTRKERLNYCFTCNNDNGVKNIRSGFLKIYFLS